MSFKYKASNEHVHNKDGQDNPRGQFINPWNVIMGM
jgi:hypothetical protein